MSKSGHFRFKNKNISNQKLGLFKYKNFLLGPETSILWSETPFLGSGRLQKARSHREDLFCSIESFWRAVGVDFAPFSFFIKILIFKYSPVSFVTGAFLGHPPLLNNVTKGGGNP